MNYVLLIGRLGQDPEGGYTDLGKAYANFSLATNERWVDQSGQKQERTEWTRIVLWNRTAEIAMQYLHKGSKIAIQGSIKTRTFTGRDGGEKKVTEVVGNNLEMLDSNGNGNGEGASSATKPKSSTGPNPPMGERPEKPIVPPRSERPDVSTPKQVATPEGGAARPSPSDSPFNDEDEPFPDFK